MVDKGHEKAEADEAARSEDEEEHTVAATNEVMAKEGAGAESLADNTEEGESPSEAKTHKKTVEQRVPHIILRGESFSTAEDDAVDNDKRDEEAKGGIEIGDKALHDHLDDGDEGGDDNDKTRDAHLVGHHSLDERDNDIGHHEDESGGEAHAEAVDGRRGGGECGAHAKDENPRRIFLNKTVFDYFGCFHIECVIVILRYYGIRVGKPGRRAERGGRRHAR